MSIASRIQEIETHIGNAYTSIDNLGIDISNTNKNIYNISALLDTFYESLPKVSGIGTNLSLSPTMVGRIKLNEIQGNTLQENTPTPDTPVEIQSVTGLQNINVCGKNLLNLGTKSITTYYQESNLYIPAGTYTMSAKITSDDTQYTQSRAYLYNGNTLVAMFTLSRNIRSSETKTLSASADRIIIYSSIDYSNSNGKNATWEDIQLEQGLTATEYEPYKGNTYEVNLGKNLFDINGTFIGNLIKYNNGFQLIKNNTNRTINYFPSSPIPKGTYTLSYEIVSSTLSDITKCIAQAFNSSNTLIATKQFSNDGYVTFTTTGDITKIYFYISNTETNDTQITLDNIQLEKGSQATSYSPYFTPIELNKINTYQDSIKKSTGKNIITTYNYASSGYINYNYDNSKIGKIMTYSFIPNFSTTNATLYIRANTSINSYKVGTISTITSGTKVSVTFTLTDEQYNIIKNTTGGYIQVYKSGVSMDENSISNPMLEINNQATDYEPYGKVWYVEKNTRKLELAIADMNNNENYPGWIAYDEIKQLRKDVYNGIIANALGFYTNYYTNIATNNSWVSVNFNSANEPTLYLGRGYWGSDHTQTYWKTNYPNLIVTLIYGLQTPTYTEITNTELINQLESIELLKGENNITITSENLSALLQLTYYKQTLQGNIEYLDETKANKEDIPSLDNYYTKQEVNNLIPDELSDLRDDSTHRLVSDSEKSTWNNKLDSSALDGYVKNTDYASSSKAGVINTGGSYGFGVNASGNLYVGADSYSTYQTRGNLFAISKGTLENVITGKGLINNSVNNLTNYTKTSDLSSVATSGSYNDLSNKPTIPTIPTNVSTFTNDAGYITNSVNNLTNYTTTTDMNTALGNKQNAVLSGTTDPTSNLGEDGDIYLQYEQ